MTGQAVPRRRWRAAHRDDLRWAEFDGRFVLYHRRSGQTHFLNAASAVLLQDILVDEVDLDAACRAITPALDGDASAPIDPDRLRYMLGLLERFEELGLVERVED